ncbi:MAG: hypothetical protein IPI33_08745 [Dehalococcoidia bacterium]|nr:hypothetical protein [Dehalococcoidia bacterium]
MSSPLNTPEPVARVAAVMSTYSHAWALCGGWAVDSWLGRVTREHADLDIAVFESDQRALLEHLAEWNLIAHDEDEPQATEPWSGRTLVLPAHLHAREPGAENAALVRQWVTPPYTQAKDGRDFEFIVNRARAPNGSSLAFRASPSPSPSASANPPGASALAPEAIAFYKATAYLATRSSGRARAMSPTSRRWCRCWTATGAHGCDTPSRPCTRSTRGYPTSETPHPRRVRKGALMSAPPQCSRELPGQVARRSIRGASGRPRSCRHSHGSPTPADLLRTQPPASPRRVRKARSSSPATVSRELPPSQARRPRGASGRAR